MHHKYTRRLVIFMVSFFVVSALFFGAATSGLRELFAPADPAAAGADDSGAVVLPSGEATFSTLCSSCHQADAMAARVADSLDPDATSLGQLEFLIGPPPHGGASPAEALAVVIYFRTLAGLPSAYEPGVPTPAAVATEVAARPTATEAPAQAGTAEATAETTTEATTEAVATEVAAAEPPANPYEIAFEDNCRSCHRPGSMVRGLSAVEDPEKVSLQAINFIATSRQHRNVEQAAIVPAFNYIRVEAGLAPLSPDVLDQVLADEATAEATPDS